MIILYVCNLFDTFLQVSILSHKKERAAEELNAARAHLADLQSQLESKKLDTKGVEGEFLKGDEVNIKNI